MQALDRLRCCHRSFRNFPLHWMLARGQTETVVLAILEAYPAAAADEIGFTRAFLSTSDGNRGRWVFKRGSSDILWVDGSEPFSEYGTCSAHVVEATCTSLSCSAVKLPSSS